MENSAPQCGSLVMQLQAKGCSGAVGSVCAVKAMQVVVCVMRVTAASYLFHSEDDLHHHNDNINILENDNSDIDSNSSSNNNNKNKNITSAALILLPQTELKISLTDASGAAATCSDDEAPLRYRLLAMTSSCSSSSKGFILSEATIPSFSSIQMATNVVAVRQSTRKTLHSSRLHHYSVVRNPYPCRCRLQLKLPILSVPPHASALLTSS